MLHESVLRGRKRDAPPRSEPEAMIDLQSPQLSPAPLTCAVRRSSGRERQPGVSADGAPAGHAMACGGQRARHEPRRRPPRRGTGTSGYATSSNEPRSLTTATWHRDQRAHHESPRATLADHRDMAQSPTNTPRVSMRHAHRPARRRAARRDECPQATPGADRDAAQHRPGTARRGAAPRVSLKRRPRTARYRVRRGVRETRRGRTRPRRGRGPARAGRGRRSRRRRGGPRGSPRPRASLRPRR